MTIPARPLPIRPLPPPLRAGDPVRLVAASSALADRERLDAGLNLLRSWGLEVLEGDGAQRRWGYLAGDDQARAADLLQQGTPAPALRACLRGGWGAARLLEAQPALGDGWLLGFSDVTSLLWAQLAQGHRGAIHGPMLTTLAAEPAWSQERLRSLLFGAPLAPLSGRTWVPGRAQGPLLVGNLTVASHLLGTGHLPALAGAVLILEDVGEAPYRLDRLLTHWRLAGALQQLAAIGFGNFLHCEEPADPADPIRPFTVEEVLRERTADLGIPVVADLPVGHAPGNAALPLGVTACLEAGADGSACLSLVPAAPPLPRSDQTGS